MIRINVNRNKNNYNYNIFFKKVWIKINIIQNISKWLFVCYNYYFDRIDVSEGIDVNKTNALKECDICRYLLLLSFNQMSAINFMIVSATRSSRDIKIPLCLSAPVRKSLIQ